jgi:uncharacterized protein (TIRG00374 family)
VNLRRALPWIVLVAIVALVAWKLHTSHFDWTLFGRSLRTANLKLIGLAVLVIWSNNLIRAMRWAVFLRPALRQSGKSRVHWWSLLGSQFIGFAGLAIFGRIGELIRPLLVSRRTGLTFSSQVAVVMVERVFDLVAFGLIFAVNLLFAPNLQTLPHLKDAGYFIAGLTVALAAFVAGVRVAGGAVAGVSGRLVGLVSKDAGAKVAEKILEFQSGLYVIDSFADLCRASLLSLALWIVIAVAYVLVMKAFPDPVHALTPAHTIVLMGFSIAGSALPIPGGSGAWAGNSIALQLFGIGAELAASAGLLLWLITTMSVVPPGLVYAKIERISLGQVARRSEAEEAKGTG